MAAFRKLSTKRNGGGGGEESGRVVELEEEGGRSGRDASRGLRTRVRFGPTCCHFEALRVAWWGLEESEGEGKRKE